ncbi:MAG: hypothetical protein AAFY31_06620 [Pseudomonadota bacterium]
MARFTKSNKVAARDMAVVNTRRPGTVKGFIVPVSRGDLGNFIVHPTSG